MERITDIPRLPDRPADAHKGTFGKLLIVAGSRGMTGAAALASRSALRSGAGLVTVATPETVQPIVALAEPCYTTLPLPDADGTLDITAANELVARLPDYDAVACGPGLGTGPGTIETLRLLLTAQTPGSTLRPTVIDADGLNTLCRIRDWPRTCVGPKILTPHPGEMRRLWNATIRDPLPKDRIDQATALAERTGCIVVLKGAGTVVTDARRVYVNPTGNPGMATGGSGDVLTGVITALCGQHLDPFDAAVLGVYVHGLAGDLAAEALGTVSLIATDIIEHLPAAFRRLSV